MAQDDRNGLQKIRAVVSQKKHRFRDQGFDLDLTYITKNVIAMGFPSSGTEAVYRNPLPEVLKFFAFFHPNQYKVYNLCIEKQYPANTFPLQACFPHYDHNPPPFKTLVDFCEDARMYLEENPSAVIAVHCKAGKGRTGTAIASYLCMKECATAEDAMNLFGKARTSNNKGVTIPSQHRLVTYYATYVKDYVRRGIPFNFNYPQIMLKGFVLTHCPNADDGGCVPYFKIFFHGEKKPRYNMHKHQKLIPWKKAEIQREFRFPGEGFPVTGDFRIAFFDKENIGRTKLFSLWLNSGFFKAQSYVFSKMSLDGPQKDVKSKTFHSEFSMELLLHPFSGSTDNSVQDCNNTPFIPERVTSTKDESSGDDDDEEDEEFAEEGKRRPNSVLEGYVNIRTKGKAYRRFYLVLFPSEMSYFDTMVTKRAKDTILLTNTAKMGFIADSETEFWVAPSSDGRVYDLQAKSPAVRRTWMEAIASSILEFQKRQHSRSPSAHRRAATNDPSSERKHSHSRQNSRSQETHQRTPSFSFLDVANTEDDSSRQNGATPHSGITPGTPSLAPPSPRGAATSPRMSVASSQSPYSPRMSVASSQSPYSPRASSPSPRASISPGPGGASSLAQLRAMVQSKQQSLARTASDESNTTEQAGMSISVTPSGTNNTHYNFSSTTPPTSSAAAADTNYSATDSSATALDLQVMEKLKQIQKLLDQSSLSSA